MDARRSFCLVSKEDDFSPRKTILPNRLLAGSISVTSLSSGPPMTTCGPKIACRPAVRVCFVVYLPCIASVGRTGPRMWRLQSKKDWGGVGAVEPASV
jgi:hypothetical protein